MKRKSQLLLNNVVGQNKFIIKYKVNWKTYFDVYPLQSKWNFFVCSQESNSQLPTNQLCQDFLCVPLHVLLSPQSPATEYICNRSGGLTSLPPYPIFFDISIFCYSLAVTMFFCQPIRTYPIL